MTRDERIERFFKERKGTWQDWNVPAQDGQVLHDLIVSHGYTRALEIGTSTGYSGIWLAKALAKSGGRLVTIEEDRARHDLAVRNFEEAGVADLIDAHLDDAHAWVASYEQPVDFVFCDADKEWYTQYFIDIDPNLVVGGCFTAHNVLERFAHAEGFLDHVRSQPNYETRIDRSSSSGISISIKKTA